MPDVVTLPQHFKNNGYLTRSLGKIYHVGIDDPQSWSVPPWHSKKPRYGPTAPAWWRSASRTLKASGKPFRRKARTRPFYGGPAFEAPDSATTTCSTGTRPGEPLTRWANWRRNRSSRSSSPSALPIRTSRGWRRRSISISTGREPAAAGQPLRAEERAGLRCHERRRLLLVCQRAEGPGDHAGVRPAVPARLSRGHQLRGRLRRPPARGTRPAWPARKHRGHVLGRPWLLHGRAQLVGRQAQQLRGRHQRPAMLDGLGSGWERRAGRVAPS